jgi:hypothetical protein
MPCPIIVIDECSCVRSLYMRVESGLGAGQMVDHAIKNSHDYDDAIRQKMKEGKSGEALFFELAVEDLRQAADLFRPIHEQTNGVDGWVSLEVSPLLAHDTVGTLAAAKALHSAQPLHQDTGNQRGTPGH